VQGVDHLLLDLVFHRTEIPGHTLQYAGGLQRNIDLVKADFIAARQLQPVRMVIHGPPASGKSLLADELGKRYSVPVYRAKDIIASSKRLPEHLASNVEASLNGKDGGRLSPQQMATLCRAALACVHARNRGFILDGFPKTLREARELFSDPVDSQDQPKPSTPKVAEKKSAKGGAKTTAPAASTALPDDVPDPRAICRDLMPEALVRPLKH
jgi:Adenylate kinase